MKLVAYFLVILIFGITHGEKQKSVNVALETVLEFDKNHRSYNEKLINKAQSILDAIKKLVLGYKESRRSNDYQVEVFTDFLKKLIVIIKSFDDNDLEALTNVFKDEVRQYHYEGCKFNELLEGNELRDLIFTELNKITEITPSELRQNLHSTLEYLQKLKVKKKVKKLLTFLNSVYSQDASIEMQRVLNNFEFFKSKSKNTRSDLVDIIKTGLRALIFDFYSNKDPATRQDIKQILEKILVNQKTIKNRDEILQVQYNKKNKKIYNTVNVTIFSTTLENVYKKKRTKQLEQQLETTDKETVKPTYAVFNNAGSLTKVVNLTNVEDKRNVPIQFLNFTDGTITKNTDLKKVDSNENINEHIPWFPEHVLLKYEDTKKNFTQRFNETESSGLEIIKSFNDIKKENGLNNWKKNYANTSKTPEKTIELQTSTAKSSQKNSNAPIGIQSFNEEEYDGIKNRALLNSSINHNVIFMSANSGRKDFSNKTDTFTTASIQSEKNTINELDYNSNNKINSMGKKREESSGANPNSNLFDSLDNQDKTTKEESSSSTLETRQWSTDNGRGSET